MGNSPRRSDEEKKFFPKGSNEEKKPLIKKPVEVAKQPERKEIPTSFDGQIQFAKDLSIEEQKRIHLFWEERKRKEYVKNYPKSKWGIPMVPYKDPITMYKLVRVMTAGSLSIDNGRVFREHKLNLSIAALLKLRISNLNIRTGEGGEITSVNSLRKGVKYCTQSAVVVGVKFIGHDFTEMARTLKDFFASKVKLVSNFDEKFEYGLGSQVHEFNFGKPGLGCIQGIHCFISEEDACQYMTTNFTGVDCHSFPLMSINMEKNMIEDREDIELKDLQKDIQRVSMGSVEKEEEEPPLESQVDQKLDDMLQQYQKIFDDQLWNSMEES